MWVSYNSIEVEHILAAWIVLLLYLVFRCIIMQRIIERQNNVVDEIIQNDSIIDHILAA